MRARWIGVWLVGACGAGEFSDVVERPVGYQAPPGAGGLTLSGPPVALKRAPTTWVARAPDLEPGDRVVLGWGGMEGSGICPYRQLIGGHLCIDISGPARVLADVVAVADPDNPGAGMAVFDVVVPGTTRDRVYLQAISVDGLDSATSGVLEVELPNLPPCPGSELVSPASQAELDSYRGCQTLDRVTVSGNQFTSVDLPVLTTVHGRLLLSSLGVVPSIELPSLRQVGTTTSEGLNIQSNHAMDRFAAPLLQTVAGDVRITGDNGMSELDLSSLRSVGLSLYLQNNPLMTAVDFPSLEVVSGLISVRDQLAITDVSLPNLHTSGLEWRNSPFDGDLSFPMVDGGPLKMFIDGNGGDHTLSFPALQTSHGLDIQDNPGMTALSVPMLEAAGPNGFGVQRNDALETIEAPLLETVNAGMVITDHAVLNDVDLGSLSSVALTMRLQFNPAWCVDAATDWDLIGQSSVLISGNLCNP